MENVVFSEQNLVVQRSVEEIKQLKAVIACRIASLQEAVHQRTELQTSLQHFASRVQQLQGEQYQLFRKNVDQQFKQKQDRRNIGKIKQEIEQGSDQEAHLIKQIQATEKQRDTIGITNEAKTEEQRQLCEKQLEKKEVIKEIQNKISEMDEKIKSLYLLAEDKQNSVLKLKQAYLNSSQALEKVNQSSDQVRNLIKAQQSIFDKKQTEKQASEKKIEGIHHSIKMNQQEICLITALIGQQQLQKRLLTQKKRVNQARLKELQTLINANQTKLERRKIQTQQRSNKRQYTQNKWVKIRQKIHLETSYSKFYLHRVR